LNRKSPKNNGVKRRDISEIKRRKQVMLAKSQRPSPDGRHAELKQFKGGRPLIVEQKV